MFSFLVAIKKHLRYCKSQENEAIVKSTGRYIKTIEGPLQSILKRNEYFSEINHNLFIADKNTMEPARLAENFKDV